MSLSLHCWRKWQCCCVVLVISQDRSCIRSCLLHWLSEGLLIATALQWVSCCCWEAVLQPVLWLRHPLVLKPACHCQNQSPAHPLLLETGILRLFFCRLALAGGCAWSVGTLGEQGRGAVLSLWEGAASCRPCCCVLLLSSSPCCAPA